MPLAAATLAARPGPGPQRVKDPLSTLTPRETEVLRRIAAGQNTQKMAREMNVTTETLRWP